MRALLALVLALAGAVLAQEAPPAWAGRFVDAEKQVALALTPAAGGARGVLVLHRDGRDQAYEVLLDVQAGGKLEGTFGRAGEKRFPLEVTPQGDLLAVRSGRSSYRLARRPAGPGDAAALGTLLKAVRPRTREEEVNAAHEWETFGTEVENLLINARSQVASAQARLRDRDPEGAIVDLREGLKILDDLPLLVADFQRWTAPARLEEHLRGRQDDVRAVRRDAHRELGRAHLARGALDEAAKALEAGLALGGTAEAQLELRVDLARVDARRGRREQARGALEKVLKEAPGATLARAALARLLLDGGDHEAALACAAKLPAGLEAALLRGEVHLAAGKPAEAAREFDAAVAAKDDSFEAYVGRGRARAAQGRHEEALEDLTEAIDLDPSRAEGYHRRGEAWLLAGRPEEGLRDLEVALLRAGDSPAAAPVRVARARLLVERGLRTDLPSARDDLRAAVAAVPADAPEALPWLDLLVTVCGKLEDEEGARAARDRAVALRKKLGAR